MQTISTVDKTTIGLEKRSIGDNPPNMGMFGPSQAAPPVSSNNPILSGLPLTDVLKAVDKVLGRFNVLTRRFSPSIME